MKSLYNSLDPSLQESSLGKGMAENIKGRIFTVVGKPAMEFTQKDTSGHDVSLSSFKGKYVLIDFWASWCVPCRNENPTVVKAYTQFKSKGFEILGISLDQSDTKWKEAIIKDDLTWTHVSDLLGWKNAVAKQYNVKGVPANFLIDPAGNIIAKDLRGDELQKKLAEIFN